MTPIVSEKDSSVVLPQPFGQVRPQWTLEVDPGHYVVVATVGDRNVGFAAYLEVGGVALFNGEWMEAGAFKSRCVLCIAAQGTITAGPQWSRGSASDRDDAAGGDPQVFDSPPSPRQQPGGGAAGNSPRSVLSRGTRLVSLRVLAAPIAREVERERRPLFAEINQKIAEARSRAEGVKQSKLAELYAQKALKLFSMVATFKRVTHPYIYPNAEASSMPPIGQPDWDRSP